MRFSLTFDSRIHVIASAIFIFSLSILHFSCASADIHQKTDESAYLPVRLAPGVDERMLSPQFWISRAKNPGKVKMSRAEISLFNRANEKILFPGSSSFYILYDLRKIDSVITAREIKRDMAGYSESHPWYKKIETKNGEKIQSLTKNDWAKLRDSMNYSAIEDDEDYPVRKAICVARSNIRQVPNADFYSDDENYWYDDIASSSGILMNEPVLVLWESLDKAYYFVKTSFCTGWIPSSAVAFCSDREFERYFDWTEKNQRDFVTITEDRYHLSDYYAISLDDKEFQSAKELFLGTYLFTADWNDEKFDEVFSERQPYSSFLVEIPYRKSDGTLGKGYASLPSSACFLGLLPYTAETVLNLALKMSGNRYGWGGMAFNRDCSEYLKDIFRCFGFQFPRNSRAQLSMAGKTVDFEKKSSAEKKSLVSSLEAGTFLGFPGHVFMYLGKIDDKNYVMSALGSYYFPKNPENSLGENESENNLEKIDANSVTINTLDEIRKNGLSWLENLTQAKILQNDGSFFDDRVALDKNWKFAAFSKINSGKAVFYKATKNRKNIVVAVNAGHGTSGGTKFKTFSHPDKSPKVTGGTNAKGAVESLAISDGMVFNDGKSESEVNLRVARFFKNLLLDSGYDVLMLRDFSDVALDNVARTVIANNNAEIHIAIHFDGDSAKDDKGCFYCSIPKELEYLPNVKKHCQASENLGECLVRGLKNQNLPIYGDGKVEVDLTQTSYSTIPTVDIELGNEFSSTNTKELEKRAKGLLEGVELFFNSK